MKWYERHYGIKGEPYPLFLNDLIWSAVGLLVMGTVMFAAGVAVPWIAASCSITTLLLARMMVRRGAQYRARTGLAPRRRAAVTPLTRSRPRSLVGN
jgi:hypothetical protein